MASEQIILGVPVGTSSLSEKGRIITEAWANTTSWTSIGGSWTVGSGLLNMPAGANNFTTAGLRQSAYGSTKLRKWTLNLASYIIPTISGTSYGLMVGMHSMSTAQQSITFRFCTDSVKQGLIEVYYERIIGTIYAVSQAPLAITAGDSTSIRVQRILNTFILTWFNNTTGKEIVYRFENPANNGNAKPPNYSQFAIYNGGPAGTIGGITVDSNELVGAKLWIQSDSIASTTADNINQSYPQILNGMINEYVAVAFGNSDKIEENNWAEVVAHAPENVLLSCVTNNVSPDSTATMLTKIAAAITALTGYTYGTNLFITNILNRNDVDVTAHNTALEGAYANTIDLGSFKTAGATTIDVNKSTDGVHPNPEGHVDYATILFNYFKANGVLTAKDKSITYNRPLYHEGKLITIGTPNAAPAIHQLEIFNNDDTSQVRIRGNGTTTVNGVFVGITAAGGAHWMTGIGRLSGGYVAKATANSGIEQLGGSLFFYCRTGATIGTTYTLNESSGSWAMTLTPLGGIKFPKTVTAAGTTGNRTINSTIGSVNIAAAGTTVTVTNSLVTTSSIIMITLMTVDTTAKSGVAVPSSGSFVVTLNAAATAETKVAFMVIN